MSLTDDINFMMMSIQQLSAENAMLRSILANSSNPRGFEEFYDIGKMPTQYGFMDNQADEFALPFQNNNNLRRKFDFLA